MNVFSNYVQRAHIKTKSLRQLMSSLKFSSPDTKASAMGTDDTHEVSYS